MADEIADLQKAVAEQGAIIAREHAEIAAELEAMNGRIEELEEQLTAENPDMELIAAATADIKKHSATIASFVEPDAAPHPDQTLPEPQPTPAPQA